MRCSPASSSIIGCAVAFLAGRANKIVKKTSKPTPSSRTRSPARRVRASAPRATSSHEAALVAFAQLAEKLRIRWYVFGAHAVNFHGFARATADLDLTIELGELALAKLIAKLRSVGFSPRFADEAFIATTRVIPVVHLATKLPIDLVLAGPGLEQKFFDEIEVRRIAKRDIPVLSLENLIVTKLLAGRVKDLEDIRELVAIHKGSLRHRDVHDLLELLEQALGRSDLVPLYQNLRSPRQLRRSSRKAQRRRNRPV